MSYNLLRFTPLWYLVLFAWLAVGIYAVRRMPYPEDAQRKLYWGAIKFLIAGVIILILTGGHLYFVLFLPFLILPYARLPFWKKTETEYPNFVKTTARVCLVLLAISVPISYFLLWPVLGEPQARQMTERAQERMKRLRAQTMVEKIDTRGAIEKLAKTDSNNSWEDPFGYRLRSLGPLAVFIGGIDGIDFYEGRDAGFKSLELDQHKLTWSRGPDGLWTVTPESLKAVDLETSPTYIALHTYDPTNGSLSSGDIFERDWNL